MRRRWVMIDGELREVTKDWQPAPRADYHVMGDIKPYKSMIDGSIISSRSRHREHLKAHNCVEVGNDPSIVNARPKPIQSPPGLKEEIIRAANQIEERDRRSKRR